MKTSADDFALLGGQPALAVRTNTGNDNLPEWSDLERELRGIFERRYFANNGPLVRRLDAEFARYSGVKHAVCVTNDMVGAMVAARALELAGDAVMPATAAPVFVEGVRAAGLRPVFCDVDPQTFAPTAATFAAALTSRTRAFAGAHPFGRCGVAPDLAADARASGVAVIVDAGTGAGCTIDGGTLAAPAAAAVVSFGFGGVLNGAEGAAVLTDDDTLAARMRTIRNFHAGETFAPVTLRINGKMSEAQAALVLAGLPSLDAAAAANERRFALYARGLAGIPGITLVPMSRAATMCAQVVVRVEAPLLGIGRDGLLAVLAAENVAASIPVSVRRTGFAGADRLAATLLELPNGQTTTGEQIEAICALIGAAARHAAPLREALERRA